MKLNKHFFRIQLMSLFLLGSFAFAQVGIGTNTPNASSVLDVNSTDKGILIPQVTLTDINDVTTITNGNVESLLVYNTTAAGVAPNNVVPGYYYWDSAISKWVKLTIESDIADVRVVGTNNHITSDAGNSSNGTDVGTGTDNIGIGQDALTGMSTGNDNIAIGSEAVSANIGNNNIGIGLKTMNNAPARTQTRDNIAIGERALLAVSGRTNIGIGELALQRVSANNNIAIGSKAANTLTSGENNIILGTNVQPNIGVTEDNQLNIGDWIFGDDGDVGIGVPAPTQKLEVAGKIKSTGTILDTNGTIASGGTCTQAGEIGFDGTDFFGCNGSNVWIILN